MEEKKWWSRLFANRVFTHIGLLVLAIIAFWVYTKVTTTTPSVTEPQGGVVIAPTPPEVDKKVPRKKEPTKPGTSIEYFSKPELATVLKMPEIKFMQDNVIAVAVVAPHRGKTTVLATIGLGSDNVYRGGIDTRREAVPFWGWEREWHGGLWYGVSGRNKIQGELEFVPMRIGPVYPSTKGILGLEDGGNMNGQLLLGVRF